MGNRSNWALDDLHASRGASGFACRGGFDSRDVRNPLEERETQVEAVKCELLADRDLSDLTRLLDRRRHTVMAVSSVTEARLAVEHAQFDLVISDLGLPDGSGNLLMTELRSRFGLRGIALSGYGDASARSESSQAGFIVLQPENPAVQGRDEGLPEGRRWFWI
jgi:CheY-like chemotaxis protein